MIARPNRLEKLARLLADPTIRALSVDVYDTLLLRGTRPELSRFGVIARAQHAALIAAGLPSPGADALWRGRLRVHKAAYDAARAHGHEVTLGRLVADLAAHAGLPQSALPVLAQAEVAAETRMVRPDRVMVRLVATVARDRPVVLASDMYLGAAEIGAILERHAPELAHLPLLVSSDLGASKLRGDMFALIADRLGVPPAAILHLGDDARADVAHALRAGCRALWWPRLPAWRLMHGVRKRTVRKLLELRGYVGAH